MNWKEMKEFCEKLNENQLSKNVVLWREDEAITDIHPMQLEEDHYREHDSIYCMPESEAREIVKGEPEYPNGLSDMKKVYEKGHPILWEKF
ncbi:hypothetical protein DN752_19555 [Echinicola strongylocentroti]|uniref:Uncharacterized protein n=1 Tax=Echinicola strongylocentroti TaxID=1795355 RepID=A0A2Z4INC9_9BACT|nr:hypothetical protein [Echinicola strongylocentroti]AWW32158.1 hypothetical protein DN752_19555 [Echinicola strongylocentroti]